MRFETASILTLAGTATAHWGYKPPPGHHTAHTSTGWETKYTATASSDVAKAAATALTSSKSSHVRGKAFDRIVIVYFENTDFDKAIGDLNFAYFAKKGLTLSQYYAVTHPSQPNYMASLSGDYYGMQNDDFFGADKNISTIIDLLEERGISWSAYQEDMPYSGFEGMGYKNQLTGANDYVRKHNPPVLHNSIATSEERLSYIKNLSLSDTSRSEFHKDLHANKLPQWMFITPNMTSDGHDSSVTVAGQWCRTFLEPLLEDRRFNDNTLILLTWDENETYSIKNNILGILLGSALPQKYVGKEDDSFYNHYSELATVQANWDLPTLGRFDVGANVFKPVAEKTHDRIRKFDPSVMSHMFWNMSYAGIFNEDGGNGEYPAPNLALDKHPFNGRRISEKVKRTWAGSKNPTYYEDSIQVPDGLSPPKGYAPNAA